MSTTVFTEEQFEDENHWLVRYGPDLVEALQVAPSLSDVLRAAFLVVGSLTVDNREEMIEETSWWCTGRPSLAERSVTVRVGRKEATTLVSALNYISDGGCHAPEDTANHIYALAYGSLTCKASLDLMGPSRDAETLRRTVGPVDVHDWRARRLDCVLEPHPGGDHQGWFEVEGQERRRVSWSHSVDERQVFAEHEGKVVALLAEGREHLAGRLEALGMAAELVAGSLEAAEALAAEMSLIREALLLPERAATE